MRCYICDKETDYLTPRDNKPLCEDCQEVVYEVMNEWYEDDGKKEDEESNNQ